MISDNASFKDFEKLRNFKFPKEDPSANLEKLVLKKDKLMKFYDGKLE